MSASKIKILVADDEAGLRTVLKKLFLKKGFEVEAVSEGLAAWHELENGGYALAILDIKMPGRSGLELLESVRARSLATLCIVMTAQDSMAHAVEAMKKGAYDYLAKPFELEELELIVDRALHALRLAEEVRQLRERVSLQQGGSSHKIVGGSRAVREVYKLIGKVAASDLAVLITGESGTGKELIAKALHQNSDRSQSPFVAVNCAAIPRDLLESELFGCRRGAFTGAEENRAGYFEAAHRGTLFLDEVGELPLSLQAKLLRALQEKEIRRVGSTETVRVDVRVLAATNQNIEGMIREKQFREDLFFRLNVVPLHLPPLRERKEDIGPLCDHFLRRVAQETATEVKKISAEAAQMLHEHAWPGNIRELENIIRRAAVLSQHAILDVSDFDFFIGKRREGFDRETQTMGLEALIETKLEEFLARLGEAGEDDLHRTIVEMAERPLLRLVLKKTEHNQIRAAKLLGMNRNTLRKKIRQLKI